MFNIGNIRMSKQEMPVSHPLVRGAYLKKQFDGEKEEQVLVLNVRNQKAACECGDFDPYLVALLNDLNDLKEEAERRAGALKHIDIVRH